MTLATDDTRFANLAMTASDAADSDGMNPEDPNSGSLDSGARLSPDKVDQLYAEYGTEVQAFLVGVLRDRTAAQDVCQMTFGRVLEAGHTARDETIKGWIFKVALREALVYRRQTARHDRHLKQYSRDGTWVQEAEEDDLVRNEDVARLRQLLNQLPPDQQHVVRQRIYDGKTFAEIAAELNVPLGTVLTRMRLALEKVRKWFGKG